MQPFPPPQENFVEMPVLLAFSNRPRPNPCLKRLSKGRGGNILQSSPERQLDRSSTDGNCSALCLCR